MDEKIFDKVIKLNNSEEYVGLSISEYPQYKEIMKNFKIEFNTFVEKLETDDLEIIGLHKNYQNSGYYNKYFWAKLVFKNEYKYEDIAIWIGIDREGIYIYLGTSDKLEVDRNSIHEFFRSRVVKRQFDDFILDDTSFFTRYKYIGNKENLNHNSFINVIKYLTPIYKEALEKFVFNTTNEEIEDNMVNQIKNIILYGPPGVGKTHNYQRLISMIEEGRDEKTIFDTVTNNQSSEKIVLDQEIYQKIHKEERVEFITFHQSYSYEDFIEGFRPTEDGNIKLEDGIFKLLANQALENLLKAKEDNSLLFKEAIDALLKDKIESEESVTINLKRSGSFYKIYDYNDKTIFFEKQNGDKSHSLSLKTLQKMYDSEENNIIKGGLAPYYEPLLEKLLIMKHQYTPQQEEQKNYYIVIDEINRGNISKIFGELITLLEEDKRDSYEVTLPYSKEKFLIPSNLYIIATMNSTDKSIATIDIALRRRFTFLKMQPNSNLVQNEEAKALMNSLNAFIQERLGSDFLLGHSYFMGEDVDLEFIKEYKIRPLLEEYFYADEAQNIDKLLSGENNAS